MAKSMKEQIKDYLDAYAKKDAEFAKKYANERKTLEHCITFVAMEARKYMEEHKEDYKIEGGIGGDVDDDICFGFALHYYDESGLDIDKTEEELKAEREARAKEIAEQSKSAKRASKKTPKKEEKKAISAPSKPTSTKSSSQLLLDAIKAKQKADEGKTKKQIKSEERERKSAIKSGNDCGDLFSEFFS